MPQFTNSNLQILFAAAQKLNLSPVVISVQPPILSFRSGQRTHQITEKSFGLNSTKTINLSLNKSKTIKKLSQYHLPVPQQIIVHSVKEYLSACQSARWRIPQVIKPLTGQKGQFVFLNIQNKKSGQSAVKEVLNHYPDGCLIESYHQGNDYRFFVLNFKVIGVAQRLTPTISGNGRSTIKQLIDTENQRRLELWQTSGKRLLNRMRNWQRISWHLHLQGQSLQAVLPKNKTITLYPIPNFSTGGSVKTIPLRSVNPALIRLAETAAKIIGLKICGIDIIAGPDLSGECRIIELNSDPGLRLHDWPNQGKSQHVAEKILSYISTGINSKLS